MKILIILKKHKGGVGVVIKYISKELRKLGYTVKIISREDDLKVYSLLRSIPILRKKVNELMKNEGYDIIHTHDWSLAFPLIFPYPIYKDKHFCSFYGNQPGITVIMQILIGKMMGDHLIVAGSLNKKRFPKSTLNPNAVYTKDFKPLHKKRRYLGWIDKKTEKIDRKQIINLGKELEIPTLIAEKIPHEKMNEFYNKCKIFVSLPPKAAASALSWMEAMAAGVPIIIGNKEGEGDLLPIDKIENFKSLKEAILNSKKKDYRKWLKKKEDKFSWKGNVRRLIKLMEN